MAQRKKISIIVRVTENCNLHCRYCHVQETTSSRILPLEQFSRLLDGLAELGYDHIALYWHGGEPLLAGIRYFRKVVAIERELSKKYKVEIENKMQSNGTLINKNWVEFFQVNNFRVGLSIDGNPSVNDRNRVLSNGKSSFGKAIRGLELMQSAGLDTSILSVLTRENLQEINDYYAFVKSVGVKTFKVNPCFIHKQEYSELEIKPVEWGHAMIALFDLWFHDTNPPFNREFHNIVKSFFTGKSSICIFNRICFDGFISVIPNGDVFPCARLINEDPTFALGNINNGMESVISKHKLLIRNFDKIGCNDCRWQSICNGGCTALALWENKTVDARDYLCEGYKSLFQHMYDTVQQKIAENNQMSDIHLIP